MDYLSRVALKSGLQGKSRRLRFPSGSGAFLASGVLVPDQVSLIREAGMRPRDA